uniref:Uncharacterized protein n=1 Tax=Steinernema glaseri TaxID=37863 RepID=A0A1I7ZVE6_9BILA
MDLRAGPAGIHGRSSSGRGDATACACVSATVYLMKIVAGPAMFFKSVCYRPHSSAIDPRRHLVLSCTMSADFGLRRLRCLL